MLCLWPGFSRSGATIAGGMLIGCTRRAAGGRRAIDTELCVDLPEVRLDRERTAKAGME